jgi:CheY-like chemotaxis protein
MSRVLVIEDEDPLRRIVMMNLVRRGYTVTEADTVATAREALATAAALHTPFDVLLLDLNLPDQTGWDVLRGLATSGNGAGPPHMPRVIVMTAVHPAQCRLDEFRPDALLIKPFPIDALLRAVARLLGPWSPDGAPIAGDETLDDPVP